MAPRSELVEQVKALTSQASPSVLVGRIWDGIVSGEGVWNSGGSVYDMADEYRAASRTIEGAVRSLIRWQSSKAAATGFVAGVPGLTAMVVTVPFEMAMNAYLQLRMVCVIAILYGWDPKSDRLRTIIMALMLGSAVGDATAATAARVGRSSLRSAIKTIPRKALTRFNRLVRPIVGSGRAVTKAGQTGLVNLSKFVPIAGGVAGGTIDWSATYVIGRSANRLLRNGPALVEKAPAAGVEVPADTEPSPDAPLA